ncbi:MAG: hypothetical protein KJ949_02830 [Nanoarchaeota archaeon]|nr:hypothetical protein [Nanoarchaeota archaeon]MBU4308411.1 hypothetical protein [Nanoarchaeota archaeon]
MTNKNLEEKTRHESTKRDALGCILSGISGTIIGAVKSYVHPTFIPNQFKEIRKEGVTPNKNYSEFIFEASCLISYLALWRNHIEMIVNNPEKIENYLPLATNFLMGFYRIGKYFGKKIKDAKTSI